MTDVDQPKTEILIIRRSSGDDHEGHHGGAWKIAYADFVTAMMAFFLVMWLINVSVRSRPPCLVLVNEIEDTVLRR